MKVIKSNSKDFIGAAPKLEGDGNIKFKLWVNENYELYVQLVDNERDGTFSDRAFLVSDFLDAYLADAALNTKIGYKPSTGEIMERVENNDAGFLKAVLRRLLPEY